MILHRLKRQTAKIKIDLLMFFAKKLTENNFQRILAESVADVQEDINVLVLLMTWSPDDRELYYLKPRRNNVLLNENKLHQFLNINKENFRKQL
jgi:hypothetical protein